MIYWGGGGIWGGKRLTETSTKTENKRRPLPERKKDQGGGSTYRRRGGIPFQYGGKRKDINRETILVRLGGDQSGAESLGTAGEMWGRGFLGATSNVVIRNRL